MPKIDPKEIERKINSSGVEIFNCPVCEASSDYIVWSRIESDTGIAWMDAECGSCGANWKEDYKWVGISDLNLK